MRILKTLSLFPVVTLAAALLVSGPVRADDSRVEKLTPQVQALLDELRKMEGGQAATEAHPAPAEAPATEAPAATPPKAATPSVPPATMKPVATFISKALKIVGLQTAGLTPSAPLGGHGTTGGESRLSVEDWRQLFPLKEQK